MIGPIIAGEHPFWQAMFVVSAVVFFGIAVAKPEWFGPLQPYIERLLNR